MFPVIRFVRRLLPFGAVLFFVFLFAPEHAFALTVTKQFNNHPSATDVFDFGQPVTIKKIRVQAVWAWEDGGTIGVTSLGVGKTEAASIIGTSFSGWLGTNAGPSGGAWLDSTFPCPDGSCQLAVAPGSLGFFRYGQKDDGGSGALAPTECRGYGLPSDSSNYDYCFGITGYAAVGNTVQLTWYGATNRSLWVSATFIRIMIDADPLPVPPTVDIKANGSDSPGAIIYNNSANITWTATNATSCFVEPAGWTGTANTGISTGPLTATTQYSIQCTGPGGTANDSVLVTVGSAPGASILANGADTAIYITSGSSATINWTSWGNVYSCTISPTGWTGKSSQQSTGPLTSSRTYTQNCNSVAGGPTTASDSVTVNVSVTPVPPPSNLPPNKPTLTPNLPWINWPNPIPFFAKATDPNATDYLAIDFYDFPPLGTAPQPPSAGIPDARLPTTGFCPQGITGCAYAYLYDVPETTGIPWRARAIDQNGAYSLWSDTATLRVDRTLPSASLLINNGAAYTKSTAATLNLTCTDAGVAPSGCSKMAFSNQPSGSIDIGLLAQYPFAETKSWGLEPTYLDGYDFSNSTRATIGTAAAGNYFLIQPGKINSTSLGTSPPSLMQGYGWRSPVSYTASLPAANWTVHTRVEQYGIQNYSHAIKVVARIWKSSSASMNNPIAISGWIESPNTLSWSCSPLTAICTDGVLRTDTFFINPGAVTLNNEYLFIEFAFKVVTGSSGSGTSDIFKMNVPENAADMNVVIPFSPGPQTLYFGNNPAFGESMVMETGEGLKTVRGYVEDAALNFVNISDSIVYDRTPPAGSIVINGGAASTDDPTVTLTLTTNDKISGADYVSGYPDPGGFTTMRFLNDGGSWSQPVAFAPTMGWTLSSGTGVKTVTVEFSDGAGNTSQFQDSITASPVSATGDVRVQRVDQNLDFISGTDARVDALPQISFNPADFLDFVPGGHTAYAQDLSGYTETAGSCSYGRPISGNPFECLVSTFVAPACSAGWCSFPAAVVERQVEKVVFKYTLLPPGPPTNLQAACNSNGTEAVLSWSPASGATTYRLQADYVENNSGSCTDGWRCAEPPDIFRDNYALSSFTASVVPGKLYGWWVHAGNSAGWSNSTFASFLCSPDPAADPDPGCYLPEDDDERDPATQCDDGIDNDGDKLIDLADPDCTGPTDTTESGVPQPVCSDGLDNDGDGKTDYPDDPQCRSPEGLSEWPPPTFREVKPE